MNYKIEHGIVKNFDGTAKLLTEDEQIYVVAAFYGPFENTKYNEENPFDVKVKIVGRKYSKDEQEAYESLASALLIDILDEFVIRTVTHKTISLTVVTNSISFDLIVNTVSTAAVDGGIPLNGMFYANYNKCDLIVFDFDDKERLEFVIEPNLINKIDHKQKLKESISDMLSFDK
ncbi:hypothetical protein A0H76_2131 [Hepatospora eriocheir]|uniref:Uncharacterized protein n=1 Tax=Hepatospora eriocheir TaxID=1081669 RepID=A0A1X0QK41_9MICR|nr:hypothetical protein A0H76_2131 [Hepatospora eriocheir]